MTFAVPRPGRLPAIFDSADPWSPSGAVTDGRNASAAHAPALLSDAAAIAEIYNQGIADRGATFESPTAKVLKKIVRLERCGMRVPNADHSR
jgi:hypothetical protein